MEAEIITLSGTNGIKLHGEFHEIENPKAVLCLIHGFGEHIGRYGHVIQFFKEKGYSVFAMDLQGHGKSGGLRGHAPGLESMMNDVEELLKTARAEYTDLPMFLFGHSMGGMLVLYYALCSKAFELTGFIASAPWLKLAEEPPGWKVKMGMNLARILPRFRQKAELDTRTLSKDAGIIAAYESDPLVHSKISTGLFKAAREGGEYVLNHISELSLKGLVYQGNSDSLIDWRTTKKMAENNPSMISWKEWPGVYHEPHNDLEQKEVLDFLIRWIEDQI